MFVRGWSNFIENYRMIYNDTSAFEYIGRASLPHFAGHKVTSVYGGWNLMLSKFSTKKEAAIEFIRFLQTEEAKKIMQNADLLIAESYMQGYDHHHSIVDSAKLAKETKAKKLAVIHISRKEDVGKELIVAEKIYSSITVPEDLTAIKI